MLYTFLLLTGIIGFVSLCIYLLVLENRSPLSWMILIQTLLISIYFLTAILFQISWSPERLTLWYILMMITISFLLTFFIHFYMRISNIPRWKKQYYIIYLLPVLISGFLFFTRKSFTFNFLRRNGFWLLENPWKSFPLLFLLAYTGICSLSCFLIALHWRKTAALNKDRKMAAGLMLSCAIPFLLGVLSDFFLIHLVKLPYLIPFAFLAYGFLLLRSLKKFRLFHYDIKESILEIFESIHDIVLILDNRGYVQNINNSARELLSIGIDDKPCYLPDFLSSDDFGSGLSGIIKGELKSINCTVSSGVSEYILNTVPIFDRYHDFIGILVTGQKSSQNVLLQGEKKLSTRQLQVMKMYAEGKTSSEIAELLFISKRTVEAHIRAIYHKLGINNRMELISKIEQMESELD